MTVALGLTDYTLANLTTVSQAPVGQNGGRRYLLVQNVSDVDVYVRFGAAASATQTAGNGSVKLSAGAVFEWFADGFVPSGSVNVIAASGASKSVVIWEG